MIAWTPRHAMIAGLAMIALANGAILGMAAYNRSGEPECTVHLSERELRVSPAFADRGEPGGFELYLRWRVPVDPARHEPYYGYGFETRGNGAAWLDDDKLRQLGLRPPQRAGLAGGGHKFGERKEVLLVMEIDGLAARQALEAARRKLAEETRLAERNPGAKELERRVATAREALRREEKEESRLFVVDAGVDLADLRSRYPDRSRFVIVYGHVGWRIAIRGGKAQVLGYVSGPGIGRVSLPASFHSVLDREPGAAGRPPFSAELAWGKRLEPWVKGLARSGARD